MKTIEELEREKLELELKNLRNEKSGLAAILSFFCIGLGQLVRKRFGKALALWIISLFLFLSVVGILFIPIVWIYSVYDAYN